MSEVKSWLLKHLRLLAERGPHSPRAGICSNVYPEGCRDSDYSWSFQEEVRGVLWDIFTDWPKFSGDIIYPVPNPDVHGHPEDAYLDTANVWEGEYGDLRRELLAFMIEELLAFKIKELARE